MSDDEKEDTEIISGLHRALSMAYQCNMMTSLLVCLLPERAVVLSFSGKIGCGLLQQTWCNVNKPDIKFCLSWLLTTDTSSMKKYRLVHLRGH